MEPVNWMKADDMLNLWMWYLGYLTRELKNVPRCDGPKWIKSLDDIRESSSRAVTYFTNRYTEYDPDCQLLLWCARFEAEFCKNMERCRQIWTDILNSGFDKNPSYWLMYLNTEWQFGDSKHMRKLGIRAMHSQVTSEGLKLIFDLIQQYESINGSADSMMNMLTTYEEHASEIVKRNDSEKKKIESEKESNDEKMLPKRIAVKRPAEMKEGPSQRDDFVFKKPLSDSKNSVKSAQDRAETKRTGQDNRTAFISNLAYDVTEEELKETFSKAGDIEELRVMKDFKGRGKGYAYITFGNQEGLAAAMAMDRIPINKRPAFVSKCEPDKETRKTGLRYKTGLEKNKLFVKGLPLTLEKSAVEEIFGKFGKLKEARIVTFRNGHSKGIAFVEYEDEASAQEALEKTDGMDMAEGKKISVSISNPPDKKEPKSAFGPTTVADKFNADQCLGGGVTQSGGSRGKGRTQIAFVPASVQKLSSKVPKANETEKMDLS